METPAAREELANVFQLVPVEGKRNVYRLKFNLPPHASSEGEMSEADWDKFEQDIEDAFGQVP